MPTAPDPFAAILRGIADARVDDAATSRARVQWLTRQAEEGATLAGAFIELAERSIDVRIRVRGGAEVQGVVQTVGADMVELATTGGLVVVARDHVVTLRVPGDQVPPPTTMTGAGLASARRFVDVLSELAAERRQVTIDTTEGDRLRGEVRAMGADVLTLRIGNPPTTTVLVSLDAVAMVGVLDGR
jgi:hypothetical protein